MDTHQRVPEGLAPLVEHDPDVLRVIRDMRVRSEELSGLPLREIEMLRLAALVCLDGSLDAFAWHVAAALAGGATDDDIWGILKAVMPVVGVARLVSSSAKVQTALCSSRRVSMSDEPPGVGRT